MSAEFKLHPPYPPQGDQPQAIRELAEGLTRGDRHQTLLGVTGSGKTYTMANVIAAAGMPALVISHNKTLAAQLYGEFKQFFPENAVGYFISYYDYYQPEAYIPQSNTYIEKDASVNDDIDRLRLSATSALLERDDVIIVASVSSIYGLGSPEDYRDLSLSLQVGEITARDFILSRLVQIQYQRNEIDFRRGAFRVRGDVIEVRPAYEQHAVRIELDDDRVARLSEVDALTGHVLGRKNRLVLYPAKHFVTPRSRIQRALDGIKEELNQQATKFESEGKFLEAERIRSRTEYDLELLGTIGYCPGVENYSRHLSGRSPGERPQCLLDYFPRPFLTIVDESHVTVPQIGGMFEGDRSRKETLVRYGFRLPSALDNRPLRFDEWEAITQQTIFVSATPAEYEIAKSQGVLVEQIIRPTGLVDPEVEVRPIASQVDDLLGEIRRVVADKQRVLVTTLTKRMAEDLTDYLADMGVRVKYLHSDIDALERVELLRGLRLAEFDVLVGINLLREGLDLPEVGLVAILDADKEGFLRSDRSLIQTAGRAARNIAGRVILYADQMTGSMSRALEETTRRRQRQIAYNEEHGITPRSIVKSMEEVMRITTVADARVGAEELNAGAGLSPGDTEGLAESGADTARAIAELEIEMHAAARRLEFERAASLRDRIEELAQTALAAGADPTALTDAIERALGARAGAVLTAPRARHGRRRGR
ncbi:MAG TPA: excinuclease ABC subunit UvrB [Candidatus Eisenbacteria bacterium]|nr:excinuclease ABC subunit UvrB [Candidatus Eisenbacteria bacterium]